MIPMVAADADVPAEGRESATTVSTKTPHALRVAAAPSPPRSSPSWLPGAVPVRRSASQLIPPM
jgi:hypothetical protein